MSVHEDGFRSGILAATLLFFGLFDLFQVVYTYTLRRDWLSGTQQYVILFAFALYVFTVQDRRVLPYYLTGLWLSTRAFVLYLVLLSIDGRLGFLSGLARPATGRIVAATPTAVGPRGGPVLARRAAAANFA